MVGVSHDYIGVFSQGVRESDRWILKVSQCVEGNCYYHDKFTIGSLIDGWYLKAYIISKQQCSALFNEVFHIEFSQCVEGN